MAKLMLGDGYLHNDTSITSITSIKQHASVQLQSSVCLQGPSTYSHKSVTLFGALERVKNIAMPPPP